MKRIQANSQLTTPRLWNIRFYIFILHSICIYMQVILWIRRTSLTLFTPFINSDGPVTLYFLYYALTDAFISKHFRPPMKSILYICVLSILSINSWDMKKHSSFVYKVRVRILLMCHQGLQDNKFYLFSWILQIFYIWIKSSLVVCII